VNPHDHRPGDPHSLHPSDVEERLWHKAAGVALVDLAQVNSHYGATVALENVSLKIWPGQFMAIVGPNGGGKTTLLRTILGMVPASSGKILLRGQPLMRSSLERIVYLPQQETNDRNIPNTVEEVIAMGFYVKNR
jgi:ABC-type Mn2+/Zn2+ transport system ATPase subunit